MLRADSAGLLQPPALLPDGTATEDLVAMAAAFERDEADGLVLAASTSSAGDLATICRGTVEAVSLPVMVAADFSDLAELETILVAGARRIVLRDSVLDDPDLILDVVRQLDPEAVAVEIQARRDDRHWRVVSSEGSETEWDPATWARVVEAQGASELIVGSASTRNPDQPFDLELLAAVAREVSIPVLASGHAATRPEDVLDALMLGEAAGVLLGGALSSGQLRIPALRAYLEEHGL